LRRLHFITALLVALRARYVRFRFLDLPYPHPQKRSASTAPYPLAKIVMISSNPKHDIGNYLRVGNSSNPNTAQANIQRQPDIDRCASRSTVFEGGGIESAEVPINAAAKPSPTRQAQRRGQGPRLGQAQLPAPQPRPPCLVWVWEGHRVSPHAR
jgi:hypothetical protein